MEKHLCMGRHHNYSKQLINETPHILLNGYNMIKKKRLKDVTYDPYGYEDDPGTTQEVLRGAYMIAIIGVIVFALCAVITYGVMASIDYF